MKNTKKIALILVFFLCIGIPGFPLLPKADEAAILAENRNPAEKPVLQLQTLEAYPSAYEAYYNDAFPLRNQLLDTYSALKWWVGDTAAADVTRGKNGWLFYNETLADYKNFDVWTPEEFALLEEYLAGAQTLAEAYGAQLYVFFGLNKNEVYPEYMPERVRRNPAQDSFGDVERFITNNTTVNYIPLRELFQEQKQNYPELYYPQGTHWNTIAAYYVYREVYERIQQDFPTLRILQPEQIVQSQYTVPDSSAKGRRTWADYSQTLEYNWQPEKGWYTYKEPWSEPYRSRNASYSEAGNGLKVLVYHDSFWGLMTNFAAGSADETIMYREYYITEDVIALEQPDIIILEIVQRDIFARAEQNNVLNEEQELIRRSTEKGE